MPYVGIPAYFVFGGRKLRQLAHRAPELHLCHAEQPHDHVPHIHTDDVLAASGLPHARHGNRIELVPDGHQGFNRLFELISGAKSSIWVMAFILGRDSVGRAFVDLLAEKARQGVEVRLLLDGFGSMWSRGRFVQPVRDAGGHVAVFNPVLRLGRRWAVNLRNHRKLAVIDGKTANISGMNIAREYMSPDRNAEVWIDTSTVAEGDIVTDAQMLFRRDWFHASGETLEVAPRREREPRAWTDQGVAQLVASGPDIADDPLYDAIMMTLYETRERVWIVTPYFIPDEGLFRALLMLARLGRDVRILVPAVSNHHLADLARGRFLRELHFMGAKIYFYPDGMVHAKHMVFDESVAVSGSLNFDMRSFYLNYEIAMFVYSRAEIAEAAEWMAALMAKSRPTGQIEAGVARRFVEDLALIVSPQL
jgi:cardiolipin synthase